MTKTPLIKKMAIVALLLMLALLTRPYGITFNWVLYSLILSALLLFILLLEFEERNYDSRMLALTGVLSAIVVSSRQLLHGVEFSPVFFFVILMGYSYGFVAGFTIGALSMFISNFFLGHGPWTPFQMLGLGATGGAAGMLPRLRGRAGLIMLAIYSVFTAYLYGVFTDLFSWVAFDPQHTIESFIAISSAGMVANTSRALGNVFFMLLLGPSVLKILSRFGKRFTVEYVGT